MKKKILLITKYSHLSGYGNFIRTSTFFKFLKSDSICKLLVQVNFRDVGKLKRIYKNFEIFNKKTILEYRKKNYSTLFIDIPNLDYKNYNFLIKLDARILFYGNNNYFQEDNKIVPFDYLNKGNYKNTFSIIDYNQKKIKYTNINKFVFFVYFSSHINLSIIIKIIKVLRKHYMNRIRLFIDKDKINTYKNKILNHKNILVTDNFNLNYIKDNIIYIGNSGSGSFQRLNSGMISFNFSKNSNEIKIAKSLSKIDNNFYFFGEFNNLNMSNFEKYILKLKNYKLPFKSKCINYFKENNSLLKNKLLDLKK